MARRRDGATTVQRRRRRSIPPRAFQKALTLPACAPGASRGWCWQRSALLAVQQAAERHVDGLLHDAAHHIRDEGRTTLTERDFRVACGATKAAP
jgi:histone H3/H4